MRRFRVAMLLSLIFLTLLSPFLLETALVKVRAEPETYISPNPLEYTAPEVGHNFTVDINVTDVTNLVGVGVYVWYNTTILDAVKCTAHPAATNLAPIDPDTFQWAPINDTLGRILFGFTFWPPKSGNLTLITINFTATALGTSNLTINGTSLVDPSGQEIPHDVIGGSITVGAPPALSLISLNPLESTVTMGDSFTIDINITDIANLQEYEFKLWFNNTLLNATDVISGPVNPPGTVFIPDPLQNVSNGFVRAGASLPMGQAFIGSGIMMIIHFTALAAGECTLHLNETGLFDSMQVEINHVTLDGSVTVMPKIGNFHTHHINNQIDKFPRDYAPYVPMVIPVGGKNVTIAPVITCTTLEDVFKPNFHSCKLAQTNLTDNDWSDGDANYTYAFEDWTDYDWNDIVVSLYAVTNNLIINAENFLESREAAWKNPFGVEITPMGMTVEVHWNSTDYPGAHIVTVNPSDTVDIELFAESIPGKTAFITIIPLIPPTASFDYLPPEPEENQTVTFDASDSTANVGTIISYSWNFGDGEFGIGKIVSHTYAMAGNFTVSLNVTNSVGKWDIESKQMTVKPKPLPQPVGGHAVPINISMETSNSLVSRVGLALLGTIAVTIILIRRRKRH